MKKLLCAICVLVAASVYSQDVTVLQINAEWNKKNNYDLSSITGARVKFSYLKDQPKDIQRIYTAINIRANLKTYKKVLLPFLLLLLWIKTEELECNI